MRGSRVITGFLFASLLSLGSAMDLQAQSPSPVAPGIECAPMDTAQFPLRGAETVRTTAFAFADPAFPNPDTSVAGRFQPGEDWVDAATPDQAPVFPIGPGRILAVGVIGTGDRGSIVVVEHTGPFTIPASPAGAPYVYPAETVDTILSVYAGIDPATGLAPGACVTADDVIGVITHGCAPGASLPCTDLTPHLHLEIRLSSTADPAAHSADWFVVGDPSHSSGDTFFDAQVMVDDGLRDPSAFIASLAVPCGDETSAAASPLPCPSVPPLASAVPSAEPSPSAPPVTTPEPTRTPTPRPTPAPLRDPAATLLQGIPASVRDTCVPRTDGLITGTIVAVDCKPRSRLIDRSTYFLLRPADARFVFNSRMDQFQLAPDGDCHAGRAGIEQRTHDLSIGCYVDENGKANLRFVTSPDCPAVYEGVLGTGGDLAALTSAWDSAVGSRWSDPGSRLAACRVTSGVSAPPAPTQVRFKVHYPKPSGNTVPPYQLEVTWSESVTADTRIEVYAVRTCPAKEIPGGQPCLSASTSLPSSILKLVATADADAGSATWTWPGWEILGGAVAWDGKKYYYGIVVRAVNAHGASRFVIAANGNGVACSDCVY